MLTAPACPPDIEAVLFAGSERALARELGVSRSVLRRWKEEALQRQLSAARRDLRRLRGLAAAGWFQVAQRARGRFFAAERLALSRREAIAVGLEAIEVRLERAVAALEGL